MAMSWYEHWIRRYEHRRWTTDDNRMVRLFEWGLEHLEEVREGGHQPIANSQELRKEKSFTTEDAEEEHRGHGEEVVPRLRSGQASGEWLVTREEGERSLQPLADSRQQEEKRRRGRFCGSMRGRLRRRARSGMQRKRCGTTGWMGRMC